MAMNFSGVFMLKSLSKLLFMITLLVAFVGQAMAVHFVVPLEETLDKHTKVLQVNVSSDTNNDASNSNNSYTNIDANNVINTNTTKVLEHKAEENEDDCCEVECCENECICPANSCASFMYLESSFYLSESILLTQPSLPSVIKATQFISALLYRPPIFTS
ncbi:hypothetical protein [Psychrosphaera haliotis]|uniref:CopL family metal-binding regulatory protein n=1 Tax=Psychrosphaera haliotis TaxID=555083 RepID=A0A6N8F507_9GAMM|nr:hypothetical protein [Psychrosphaera haliotis]MUH71268.1 hypothetical protein [Psychrosphaera haliotis]